MPDTKPAAMTPMLTQYLAIKKEHGDAILFYRMGDFYEMFFDDALTAAPVMEVQLTSRDRNSANPIPMCGVPHHSAMGYVQKLLAKGFKVALCEQMEDPATVKGLVKRAVVRVLTPSLIGDPDLVGDETTNLLACLSDAGDGRVEVCLFDLLGGTTRHGVVGNLASLIDLFARSTPREILLSESTRDRKWFSDLTALFPQLTITCRSGYFGEESSPTLRALESYLKETQKRDQFSFLTAPLPLEGDHAMAIDSVTLRSLEILKGNGLDTEGHSLFDVSNFTVSPMGRRTLRDWLARPLLSRERIEDRLDAVQDLVTKPDLAESLKRLLRDVRDLERLTMKTALGLAMPRDIVAIREILKIVPLVKDALGGSSAPRLARLRDDLNALAALTDLLQRALDDCPPAVLFDGGIFRDTYHAELKDLRQMAHNAKGMIAAMETAEKESTGIPSLKVKYSRVFGYTIEITKAHLAKVPPHYQRKQTIANGERFVTDDLREFEEKVVTAEHRMRALEEALFADIRQKVSGHTKELLANARLIGELDVLLGFAESARTRGYVRPEISADDKMEIEDGRHPVVETLLPAGQFVPNSLSFSNESVRTWIITGPNMAGKSTIMRQMALISVLAQAGSFVPASRAKLPLIDAVFTRIGSSDDLARGRSTFMVEMTEVARILKQATPRSLILIDEIGRGTSTYDGLSLAWALLEHLHLDVQAKVLFATHFHEITAMEKNLPGVQNASVLVEKWNDEIVFLHKLRPGICNRSYGIEVAALAGLPPKVLSRAREIQGLLETQAERAKRARSRALDIHDNQLAFFEPPKPPETRSPLGS
jgi:DNA mismatch repair protein MutS